MFGAVHFEAYLRRGFMTRVFVFVGDASYALYLVHVPLIFGSYRIVADNIDWFRGNTNIILGLLVCLVGTTIVSIMLHIIVERPISRALKRSLLPFPKNG